MTMDSVEHRDLIPAGDFFFPTKLFPEKTEKWELDENVSSRLHDSLNSVHKTLLRLNVEV